MKKRIIIPILILLLCGHYTFAQSISEDDVAKEMINDAWKIYKGNKADLNTKTYTIDKRIYLDTDNNFKTAIRRTSTDLNNKDVLAYTYNPYPFVNIFILYDSEVKICFLPISEIKTFIQLVEKITGLEYDEDSPDASPENGIFALSGKSTLVHDDEGESFYRYDSCIININQYFPKHIGGCSVEVTFSGVIL